MTTGANPAVEATPGDRIRYSLRVTNLGDTALTASRCATKSTGSIRSAAFAPGTLTLVTVPAGADTSNTTANGGTKGTGVLDVRNLTLAASASLLLEFEVTLAPVLANGSDVLNQSQLVAGGAVLALSDDPNINGAADPNVSGR